MLPPAEPNPALIGNALVNHAKEHGRPSRLPLTTQLFPYIFLASRRMSTRQISNWLKEEMKVELSAQMIVKALKNPDQHLKRLATFVQPLAVFLAQVSQQYNAADFLFHYAEDEKTVFSVFKQDEDQFGNRSRSEEVLQAIASFSETWDQIPFEVKCMCRPHFDSDVILRRGAEVTDDTDDTDDL